MASDGVSEEIVKPDEAEKENDLSSKCTFAYLFSNKNP